MKDAARTILVEPLTPLREALARVIGQVDALQLVESCDSYDQLPGLLQRRNPELVILGLDSDAEQAIACLQSLTGTGRNLVVLPASCSRDGEIILRVLRAGAREFLALPTSGDEVKSVVDRLLQSRTPVLEVTPVEQSHTLAVIGAAGGVGCTSIAANLASSLSRDPKMQTVLVDLDLLMGAVDVCLDAEADQTLVDLAHNISRLDVTLLKRSLARLDSGLHVLPATTSLEAVASIDPDSVRQILEMLRTAFQAVVLDLSKGLHAVDSVALEMADTVLLVVQLEAACLRNSARLLDLFRPFDGLLQKIRIVANRVGSGPHEISIKKAEELLKQRIEWQITNDFNLFATARSRGVPIEVEASGSRAQRTLAEMSRSLFPSLQEQDRKRSRFGRLAASFF